MKTMSLLKVLAHTVRCADCHSLLLHKSLILPKLKYRCEVYSSATEVKIRILDLVHQTAVCLTSGAFRSSAIPSILLGADVLPLNLRWQSLMLRCWYCVHYLPDSISCGTVS